MTGTVVEIFVRGAEGTFPASVPEANAEAGKGLREDRQSTTPKPGTGRDLTLIEAEVVEAVNAAGSVSITATECRRNVVTRGISLNDLVGKEFQVGAVRCLGVRLCEPCDHLEKTTRPGVMQALLHRGGLRADILSDGPIRPGDSIRTVD